MLFSKARERSKPNETAILSLDPPEKEITQLRMCNVLFRWIETVSSMSKQINKC